MTSCNRGVKRKASVRVLAVEPPSKSSKVIMLGQSLLLLEVPAETNVSLPVWEAMRSKRVDVTWTATPYSIGVAFTPSTAQRGQSAAFGPDESTPPSPAVQSSPAQKRSRVLLTFSKSTQTPPCPARRPQNPPPLPNPSTSLIVSLPLLISRPQPVATPAKTEPQPVAEAPSTSACSLCAQSNAPLLFHTRPSFNIPICDRFLLDTCHAGRKCKMHHTPYPFHWQLWSNVTHQWVDVPRRSQVTLERNYCDVNQETIHLKDGQIRYTLNFDLMELDDPSKYDIVRRLTNSDSLLKNPYFPSKWKLYWWNNRSWEEYNQTLSARLLQKMNEKEPEWSFTLGSQEYKMDFTSMTQINVTTGFQREVRCRPAYRSPESMRPYLQTGIQDDSPQAVHHSPAANFSVDPLEEFCSWYPPVWFRASEQDYSLVEVPAGTLAYQMVRDLFHESLPETRVDVLSVEQIQNQLHWDKYQRQKVYMQTLHAQSKEPLERHLFHGTTKEASDVICHNNFDPRVAGTNGSSYGLGSYFSTTSSLSHTYSTKAEPDDVRHMFLAKVLVGRVSLGKSSYRRPPPLASSGEKPHLLYDACVDNMSKPNMFVVFDSCQCYPYYLIKYKDAPREADI
ncbi:protein mono-ADP-ribosyltransferase TIPARP-like [Mugil cephalus]|uniref:protein mono-ADP-ribosyltransferase TIPARP-like n=1 Tax=Mugil cephalus TaxID=48193 RepID=UPI001FB76432|nr:protein mono-ADP-ribosyltransferase TIPARP-like [Mugil cephalus]